MTNLDSLLTHFLAEHPHGNEHSFEPWLAAHAEHADALRRMFGDWRAAQSVLLGWGERAAFVALSKGQDFGGFELVAPLGKGGQGVVWEARQKAVGNRSVALKLIPSEGADTEALAGARIAHPNCVGVITYGVEGDLTWIAQELVPGGRTLRQGIAALQDGGEVLPRDHDRRSVMLMRQVADALVAAHAAGVVHRDIKPENILLEHDGRPRLSDFGLARLADASEEKGLLGTFGYMSPEHLNGARIDERSDVFSLGAVFYELLSLRRAFLRGTAEGAVAAILQDDPTPLRQVRPELPVELETICAKCLEKDPSRRYASMGVLVEDLQRFLDDRPILAHRPGAVRRGLLWARRNPGHAVALLAGMALVPIVIAGVGGAVSLAAERRHGARLSDLHDLRELEAEADRLWPIAPSRIGDYEQWISTARGLLNRLPTHRAFRDTVGMRATGRHATKAVQTAGDTPRLRGGGADCASSPTALLTMLLDDASDLRLSDAARSLDEEAIVRELRARFEGGLIAPVDLEGAALALILDRKVHADPDGAEETFEWIWEHLPEPQIAALEGPLLELLDSDVEARSIRMTPAPASVPDSDPALRFEARSDAWLHEQASRLAEGLERLGDPRTGLLDGLPPGDGLGMERRIALARVLEEALKSPRWEEAREAIEDHPAYGGFRLTPQVGLLPLRPDPTSGLWEFWHIISGSEPPRDRESGPPGSGPEDGLTLVLLPGGRFEMGSHDTRLDARSQRPEEYPVHTVQLDAFFLSKYEMSQPQWERVTGMNPSGYAMTGGAPHPVENVSWIEGRRVLGWMGLDLPTEAQWEYAARGGSRSSWWFGDSMEDLASRVNTADVQIADLMNQTDPWDDGHRIHAPVGAYPPNPFGLYEILGNVNEWCLDEWLDGAYLVEKRAGDGRHPELGMTDLRAYRGGGFVMIGAAARCANRSSGTKEFVATAVGVRPARAVQDSAGS